jgi:hypothetical protein
MSSFYRSRLFPGHRLGVSNARFTEKLERVAACRFASTSGDLMLIEGFNIPMHASTIVVDSSRPLSGMRNAVLAIAVGGLVAGTLDLTQALVLFSAKIPLAIAAGLMGPQAFQGGAATYVLGVLLHFLIALSAAAVYFAASRKLRFLIEHPLICGLFFGAAVELVMRLIVLPLSALHAMGPYPYRDLVLGLLVHMIVVGLPISFSVQRFGKYDR